MRREKNRWSAFIIVAMKRTTHAAIGVEVAAGRTLCWHITKEVNGKINRSFDALRVVFRAGDAPNGNYAPLIKTPA
jgi:hypothetical protein